MEVLVLGGTGKTGLLVVQQLLTKGVKVRAIIRSPEKLPADVAGHPAMTFTCAKVLDLSDEELQEHIAGCAAVISCLGHEGSWQGICGQPRFLVYEALRRVCRAIVTVSPSSPMKVILMSTGLYCKPDSADDVTVRSTMGQQALLVLLNACLPPHRDNMRAAEFLRTELINHGGCIEWCGVRPELLVDGEGSPYELHEHLVSSIFSAGQTSRSSVALFMCDLVQTPSVWQTWRGKFPLIQNKAAQ
eukprot:gb/GFBE01004087.1/.p1 GENE.gb/GFBE01004087.1/~~gb/GFBE01004087.1/.p1  ORF type:complete len:245 (+),score=39.76 gb/GFBE01004087.1/:1-735(+)